MKLSVAQVEIPDVKVLLPTIFRDARGFFSEVWNAQSFAEAGLNETFVQDNQAYSTKVGTLRGLHYQVPPYAQGKLVRVARGAVFDVVVDIRRGSPAFGKHVGVILSRANWKQLWVPPGFAHGYLTIEPDTDVVYKVTAPYEASAERGVLWNDPALGIAWPMAQAEILVASRDCGWPLLAESESVFSYED